MSFKEGGPAFPVVASNGLGHVADGMSLRDYFAGQALVGFLACVPGSHQAYANAAREAYLYADEMLKAREVTP